MHIEATQFHSISTKILQLLESSRALILLPAKARAKAKAEARAKARAKAKAKAMAKEIMKTVGGSEIVRGRTNGEATTGGRCP